jgi:CHAD domain-containing protein
MASRPARSQNKEAQPEVLAQFLKRVLREHSNARAELAPDPVHDLRVALRRCRTLAEGFLTLDDHRDWRRMRKAAKKLQTGLSGLRDTQVMAGEIRQFRLTGRGAGKVVAQSIERDQMKARRDARKALKDFPRKRWRRWRRRLPGRAQRLGATPVTFARLVLERVREAEARERRWRSSGSRVAAHRLRIAVKHFRYTVQSFLPEQYAAWEKDLKRMQDALGELHDLDVLRAWLLQIAKVELLEKKTLHEWLGRIASARQERVERYKKTVSAGGKSSQRGPRAALRWDGWRHEVERLAELSSPNIAEASR